jgi:hypothetical protein
MEAETDYTMLETNFILTWQITWENSIDFFVFFINGSMFITSCEVLQMSFRWTDTLTCFPIMHSFYTLHTMISYELYKELPHWKVNEWIWWIFYFTYLAIREVVEVGVVVEEAQDPWHQVEQQQHLGDQQVLVDLQEVQGVELQHVTTRL